MTEHLPSLRLSDHFSLHTHIRIIIIIIIIMFFISIFHMASIAKLCAKQFHMKFKQKIRIFKCCNGFYSSGLYNPPNASFPFLSVCLGFSFCYLFVLLLLLLWHTMT